MEKQITYGEFIAHIRTLLDRTTTEPCTFITPYPVYDQETGQQAGTGTISVFMEDGIVLVNDSLRGCRQNITSLADILPALDEEVHIAAREGIAVHFVVGRKVDPYAPGKRGDHPGCNPK